MLYVWIVEQKSLVAVQKDVNNYAEQLRSEWKDNIYCTSILTSNSVQAQGVRDSH